MLKVGDTCAHGHLVTAELLGIRADGRTWCKQCSRARGKIYKQKNRIKRVRKHPKDWLSIGDTCERGHHITSDSELIYHGSSLGGRCRRCMLGVSSGAKLPPKHHRAFMKVGDTCRKGHRILSEDDIMYWPSYFGFGICRRCILGLSNEDELPKKVVYHNRDRSPLKVGDVCANGHKIENIWQLRFTRQGSIYCRACDRKLPAGETWHREHISGIGGFHVGETCARGHHIESDNDLVFVRDGVYNCSRCELLLKRPRLPNSAKIRAASRQAKRDKQAKQKKTCEPVVNIDRIAKIATMSRKTRSMSNE